MPDLSFSIHVPVFLWTGITIIIAFGLVMFAYWVIKAIISVVIGG
jgi:hypothetical protein